MPGTNPFDGRPLRVSVGTRPLELAEWLQFDDRYCVEMEQKSALLSERHDDVVAHRVEGDEASRELLVMLLGHLTRYEGDRYVIDGGHVRSVERGLTIDTSAWHPIDAAGRLVQEDLAIMSADSTGAWRLTAASICFPSRWRLADKIGTDLGHIHAPVPFYEERVGSAVRQLFDRLEPERPVWRLNWTLLDDSALFQPDGKPWNGHLDDFGDALFFRVERQTLRRLPQSRAIVFTIRTTVRPLRSLEAVPDAFRTLADTLECTDPRTVAYKGWAPFQAPLVAWLRSRT